MKSKFLVLLVCISISSIPPSYAGDTSDQVYIEEKTPEAQDRQKGWVATSLLPGFFSGGLVVLTVLDIATPPVFIATLLGIAAVSLTDATLRGVTPSDKLDNNGDGILGSATDLARAAVNETTLAVKKIVSTIPPNLHEAGPRAQKANH